MHENAYEVARQYAITEITKIDAQIEKLNHRKTLIAQLLNLYTQLSPLSESIDNSAIIPDAVTAEVPAAEVGEHQLPEFEAVPEGALL